MLGWALAVAIKIPALEAQTITALMVLDCMAAAAMLPRILSVMNRGVLFSFIIVPVDVIGPTMAGSGVDSERRHDRRPLQRAPRNRGSRYYSRKKNAVGLAILFGEEF